MICVCVSRLRAPIVSMPMHSPPYLFIEKRPPSEVEARRDAMRTSPRCYESRDLETYSVMHSPTRKQRPAKRPSPASSKPDFSIVTPCPMVAGEAPPPEVAPRSRRDRVRSRPAPFCLLYSRTFLFGAQVCRRVRRQARGHCRSLAGHAHAHAGQHPERQSQGQVVKASRPQYTVEGQGPSRLVRQLRTIATIEGNTGAQESKNWDACVTACPR